MNLFVSTRAKILGHVCLLSVTMLSVLAGATWASNLGERGDLLKTREAVWRAWFANDSKTLDELLPAETITISSGEEKWKSKAEVLRGAEEFHSGGGRLLSLEFPRTEIQRFGDVAVIYSQYRYVVEISGKRSQTSGRVTEIFVFRQGRWRNSGWHTDTER
jgi:Domain of unknown function (DUF4440)